jgi:hypothetical protein
MKQAWTGSLGNREAPSFVDTCRKCNTDFQINIVANEPELFLVVTTWFDLGPGLDPEDRRWTRHSSDVMFSTWFRVREDSDAVDGEINVRESFEDARSYNLSCLKDQRYKQVIREVTEPHACWYLVHNCARTSDN